VSQSQEKNSRSTGTKESWVVRAEEALPEGEGDETWETKKKTQKTKPLLQEKKGKKK